MASKAPKVRVDFQGVKEFRQGVMKELPQKIRGRIMRDAFKKAAKPAVKYMKSQVPKRLPTSKSDPRPADPTLRELKKSIGSVIKTYRNTGTTVAVIGPRIGEKYVASVYPNKKHNRLTSIAVGIERGWRGRAPNRFVRRGYLSALTQFPKNLKRQLGPAIEKEAARIFKKQGAGKKLSSSEETAATMLR
tara:strand:- start:19644 stop:20213 length:570 start_codon:yes stop_codon:yes gene_type:complete